MEVCNYVHMQDTVTGFLLAGIGQRDRDGANFLVVDASALPPCVLKLVVGRNASRAARPQASSHSVH